MSILFLMIPMALIFGGLFLYGFFWATSQGQMDDLDTPAHRMLLDESDFLKKTRKEKHHEC
jgi:cbb3-type cytochrome oxidase maturation protein